MKRIGTIKDSAEITQRGGRTMTLTRYKVTVRHHPYGDSSINLEECDDGLWCLHSDVCNPTLSDATVEKVSKVFAEKSGYEPFEEQTDSIKDNFRSITRAALSHVPPEPVSEEQIAWLRSLADGIDDAGNGDGAAQLNILADQLAALSHVQAPPLFGPHGWLNGNRALNEESWCLESDPLENSEEYFAIPLYALVDPFKEIGKDVSHVQAPVEENAIEALKFYADPKNYDAADFGDEQITPNAIPMDSWEDDEHTVRFCDCGDRARKALTALTVKTAPQVDEAMVERAAEVKKLREAMTEAARMLKNDYSHDDDGYGVAEYLERILGGGE